MHWQEVVIGGKPALCTEPSSPLASPTILFLHDARATPPDAIPGWTESLVQRRWRCLAPAAGCSWWLQHPIPAFDPTISPEEHLLNAVLPWMQQQWQVTPQRLAVVGFGMGGQGAIRLAFRHPALFPVAASIDGAMDLQDAWGCGTPLDDIYPSREAARRDSALMHLKSTAWPEFLFLACSPDSYWYRGNDRLQEKLLAHGVPHQALLDQPRSPESFLPDLFAFLDRAFAQLSRRLI
jgi:S-formylglutathione hydrolase